MNITTSTQTVGSTSNVIINMDRSKGRDGSTVTPSTISTVNYIILVSFDLSYGLNYGVTTVSGIANFTINTIDKTITIAYNSTLYNNTFISLTIIGVTNPLISTVALTTFVKISDSNNILKD